MDIEMLKGHKSPGTEQIPAEFFKAGGRTIRSEIQNLLFLFGMRRSLSKYLPIRKVIK